MHLFFESVWKLHIGEIPEKPKEPRSKTHPWLYKSEKHHDEWNDYKRAIATIKQNALTVENPEIIKKEVSIREWYHDNQPVPDRFYFWPGGADILEKIPPVAILTLPEDKKNTMENTAEKLTKLFGKHNREFRFDPQVSHRWIVNAFDEYTKTASGSVAAPKEEIRIEFDKEEYIKSLVSDLYQARQQLKEREEVIKELLRFPERKFNGISIDDAASHREYIALKAIIEKARKLLSK